MSSIERTESSRSSEPNDLRRATLPDSSNLDVTDDLCQLLVKKLFSDGRGADWAAFEKTLSLFAKHAKSDNRNYSQLINTPESKSDLSLISIIASYGAPPSIIDQMADLGVCLTTKSRARVQGEMRHELSPLHLALGNRHYHTALQLLRRGHPVEPLDSRGETPLHLLLLNRSKKIPEEHVKSAIKMLIHFGATFSSDSQSGSIILHSVIRSNFFETAELLSQHVKKLAISQNESPWNKRQIQEVAYGLIMHPAHNLGSIEVILNNLSALSTYSKEAGPAADTQVHQRIVEILEDGLDKTERFFWKGFAKILARLNHSSGLFDRSIVEKAINTPLHKDDGLKIPILHHALLLDAPIGIIDQLVRIGADVNLQAAIGKTDIAGLGLLIKQSPLYVALEKQQYRKAALLISAGALVPDPSAEDGDITVLPTFFYGDKLAGIRELLSVPVVAEKVFGSAQIRNWILNHYTEFKPQIAIYLALQCPRSTDSLAAPNTSERTLKNVMEHVVESIDLTSDRQWQSNELIDYCTKNLYLAEAAALLQAGGEIPAIYLEGKAASQYSQGELTVIKNRLLHDYSYLLFDSGFLERSKAQLDRSFIVELLTLDHAKLTSKYKELDPYLSSSSSSGAEINNLTIPVNNALAELSYLYFPYDKFFNHKQTQRTQQLVEPLVGKLLRQDGNIQDAALYVSIVLQLRNLKEEPGTALATLFNRLMFRYPMEVLGPIAFAIEYGNLPQKLSAANLVELFAFLRHPKIALDKADTIEKLTAAISSVPVFINHGITVTGLMVNCWYDIANISLGFKRFRYSTKRGYGIDDSGKKLIEQESIFEAFGGKRINTLSPKHPFQVGYEFLGKETDEIHSSSDWIIGPSRVVTFFRGGVAIADLERGITFIRNSSLHFGRDLLMYPAYFKAIDELGNAGVDTNGLAEYIRSLTPEKIERDFKNIMDTKLYRDYEIGHRRLKITLFSDTTAAAVGIEHVRAHLDIYQQFENALRKFQFDTQLESAWDTDQDGNDILVGACSSPGFAKIVAGLRREHNDARDQASLNGDDFTAATALELHNQAYPPFSPYARLVVDEDVLKTLEYIAENGWTPSVSRSQDNSEEIADEIDDGEQSAPEDAIEEFYINSGVLEFFQTALSTQSELIVVPFNGR